MELNNNPISRRDFLIKGAQMTGGAMLLSSMGGILTTCAKIVSDDDSGKVKSVVFQTWTLEAKEVIDRQIELFKEVEPNIEVTLEILSYDDYWTKMPIAIAGGAGPDLFIMTRPNFETFAKSGQAAPIEDEMKASQVLMSNLSKMNPVFVETYQYKDVQHGIPFGVDCSGVVYNKTMLEKEGLQPISEIESEWTWNDLRDYAVKLTKHSGGMDNQFGYLVSTNRLPTFEYLWSNDAELFNVDGTECRIASPQGIQAIQFLADLMLKDQVSPTPAFLQSQKADDLFLSGKIGIMSVGNWTMSNYRSITDFAWDVAELPFSPHTNKRYTSSNVLGYIVGPNAKSKDAIMKLLEQLTSQPSQQVYAEKGIFIPAHSEAQEPFFSADEPKNLRAFQRALDYSKPMKLSEWVSYPEVLRITGEAMENILSDKASVNDGWIKAQDEINTIIQENLAKG